MQKLIFAVFIFLFLFLTSQKSHSQDAVEGSYSVGKTSCTIEWNINEYRVYWSGGTGYTVLMYVKDLPNRNVVYDEYEKDYTTYTGTFTFRNDSYMAGVYTRADGKEFNIKRKRD